MLRTAKDPWAAFFDESAAEWEKNCYPPESRERLKDLVPCFGVKPGATVLDLGSGTGGLGPYLREILTESGTLVSMDVSFEMVRHAAKKPCYKNGGVVQGTAFQLPFLDRSMDTAVCFAAFPHFADKEGALR
jgi:ubiquinone/menaquinone biosynthesis C-methylase UbiE